MADYTRYMRKFHHLALPAMMALANAARESRQTSRDKFVFAVGVTALAIGTVYNVATHDTSGDAQAQAAPDKPDAVRRAEADRDKYGVLLFEACNGSLSDARAIDRSVPDVPAAFNGASMQCEAILPNGKTVTWKPGQLPLDRNWRFTLAR